MTEDTKQRCTNCKCWRVPAEYVGARGGAVKRCIKCRDKDDRQKKRPDVREKRNARQSEKQYYKAHRAKKRAEDEERYLKHNAAVIKAWRANNVNYKLSMIKYQCIDRGYAWSDDMTPDVCEAMITSPCFYCDFLSVDWLNGIDRLDNKVGYVLSNCVGCCKFCNFIKRCLDPKTFVERCVHIAACYGHGTAKHPDAWPDRQPGSYSKYKLNAGQRGHVFELSREVFDAMTETPCHYCHRDITPNNKSGVDRLDNDVGYIVANTVACCTECNTMKNSLSVADYVGTCVRVAAKADRLTLPEDIPRCYRSITKRTTEGTCL